MRTPDARSRARRFVLLGAPVLALWLSASPSAATVYVHRSPLTFTWAAAGGSVDRYHVYLSVDGRAFERVAQVGSPSYQLSVEDRRRYAVRVQAENATGTGPPSDPSEDVVVFLAGSPGDTDGDGMPDGWETAHGLDPYNPDDAAADPDGDGLTHLQEYRQGTDPRNRDTDGDGVSDGDEVRLGQNPTNPSDNRPVADAGPDQTVDPTRVTLDGSKSRDPNGDPLVFRWSQAAGPAAALADATTPRPSFLGTTAGTYRFRLVVSDGKADSPADEVVVTIRNVAPTAEAGPDQVVYAGSLVTLDGGGSSDPNRDPLSHAWSQREGPPVLLRTPRAETASFVPEVSGVYRFALVVSDGRLQSAPDEVQVVVHGLNHVPTASAGEDRTVRVNTRVVLDGSGSSDPDGDALSFAWTQREGPALVVLADARTARPTFTPTRVGVYRFRLVVHDGTDPSPPDEVTVTVEGANRAPVAVTVPSVSAAVGDRVELNGQASYDPDSDRLTYAWFQVEGPRVALEGADRAVAGFYALTEATLRFHLVVDDGELYSPPAAVVVTVDQTNRLLTADPGADRTSPPGSEVCLDGTGSYDLNPGRNLAFSWSQVDGPPATLLPGADAESPCLTPSAPGAYVFALVVSDGPVRSAPALVTLHVDGQAPPPAAPPAASFRAGGGSSGCSSAGAPAGNRPVTSADALSVLCLLLPAAWTAALLGRGGRYRHAAASPAS